MPESMTYIYRFEDKSKDKHKNVMTEQYFLVLVTGAIQSGIFSSNFISWFIIISLGILNYEFVQYNKSLLLSLSRPLAYFFEHHGKERKGVTHDMGLFVPIFYFILICFIFYYL
jgi:hypothetical protein